METRKLTPTAAPLARNVLGTAKPPHPGDSVYGFSARTKSRQQVPATAPPRVGLALLAAAPQPKRGATSYYQESLGKEARAEPAAPH